MKLINFNFLLCLFLGACIITSCGDSEPESSFDFTVSDSNPRMVSFQNTSTDASEYAWDFGDSIMSTEENPSHTYAAPGSYDVTLTASNGTDSNSSTQTVTISGGNNAATTLTGASSKTWKLFREGTSMSVGSSIDNPTEYWSGLTNDGSRPCLYQQEWTFNIDGSYQFNDKGMFWAEYGLFNNVAGCEDNVTGEACIDATAANMVNACGDDISAFLSNTHSYSYDEAGGMLTLNGNGAWIGIPKLATSGEVLIPQSSVSARISFQEFTGYDVMLVEFVYDGTYWPIRYASYSDASLEPALETGGTGGFGVDLDDISPAELSRTFASADAADWVLLDTIRSAAGVYYGVDNPDGSGDKVGQYERIPADFQELQFQTTPNKNDINFENLSTISLDVYFPSSNDYSGDLTTNVVLGFGDVSQTMNWWEGLIQYEAVGADLGFTEDAWHTITFDISMPTYSSTADQTPFDRNDLDMFYIGFGGSGHSTPGTFFMRNLVIN